ncbi:MAG: 50S ribosomal protein L24 [Candidatus Levybacteria bacterium]|nr:50S ribosomal protein L24 [Candidatus Levybacteria bacterium]
MKFKVGDSVQVMMGKDKGRVSKIVKVLPRVDMVVVEGVNEYKRHIKSRGQNQKSEIVTITKPMHVAKVAFVDPKSKKPTRIVYKIKDGKKERIAKKSGTKI